MNVSRSDLRVLFAILAMTDRGERITTRSISAKLGWKSPFSAFVCLKRLRRLSLVTYEPKKVGTIIPAVRFIHKAWRIIRPGGKKWYDVANHGKWCSCTCPDSTYRQRECKHVLALKALGMLEA